jgi:D-xylose transport system substrate-binding protein
MMKRKKHIYPITALLACGVLLLAACGSDDDSGSDTASGPQVGVILPDTASSARWENNDRPLLQAAFDDADVTVDIQNANGDKAKFQTIADGMINAGVEVLMFTNLDSATGAAVARRAAEQGVQTIDYDRLTLGGNTDYYVSFDNVAVGTTIGEGLVTCLQDEGIDSGGVVELNGSPTDNNATLFREGYNAVIEEAGYDILTSQAVPDWNNTEAGRIFTQIFTEYGNDILGVAAANDGLGGAVVSVLNREGLAGDVPVTGQDATDEGLQRVLRGTQCMTVYKAIQKEADAAAALAIALVNDDTEAADALASGTVEDTELGTEVKAVLLEPQAIFPEQVKDVVADGFTTAENLCTSKALKEACEEYGVE